MKPFNAEIIAYKLSNLTKNTSLWVKQEMNTDFQLKRFWYKAS